MLFLLVIAILLVMAVLAVAGPVLEDLLAWLRPPRPEVRRHRAHRVPQHSGHR